MNELIEVARRRPAVEAPTEAVREQARGRLERAISASKSSTRTRRGRRVLVAGGIASAALVAAALLLPSLGEDDQAILSAPPVDAAVIEAIHERGYTEIRFLDPDADPARIQREIAELGFDIRVTFIPADPFTVGHLVFSDAAEGLELVGGGNELQGGPIALRVPEGWTGSAEMAIGRQTEPGESFATSIPLNAERSGAPLHCVSVRGLPAEEAARIVNDRGYEVEWRTTESSDGGLSGITRAEKPPTGYVITDVIWSGPNTIMLFAAADPISPPSVVAELIEDCEAGT